MAEFFAELKRRQMYRVAAAYAVVAWLLLQLVNNLTPALNLPNWAATLVTVLLIVGFPIALLFCWIQHLAPGDGAQAHAKVNKIDWILVGGLAAVIALLLYQQFAPNGALIAQNKVGTEITAQTTAATGVSIAVLPFANVSGDASRDFFSDGMTDEISGTLARIRDLRVIARTSAFQFKGRNQDVRAVGQALGASHLIDGSVRQAGNRVRITAQLVRANDGVQLWSENYDRELTDVFAIQEEIALAIAGAMRVPLGLQQGERLVPNRTANIETYDQYLRARTLYRARAVSDAVMILEAVVARDPDFAPAWGLLAASYLLVPTYDFNTGAAGSFTALSRIYEDAAAKAEKAASEALRRDPRNATGYWAMGDVEFGRANWIRSDDLYRQAMLLDPADPDALLRPMLRLGQTGHFREALDLTHRLQALEPFVPVYNIFGGWILHLNGQSAAGIALLEQVPAGAAGGYFRNGTLAILYTNEGRYADAANTLLAIPPEQSIVSRQMVEDAARILRTAPRSIVPSAAPLPDLGALSWVYVYVGAPDRHIDSLERSIDARWLTTFVPPWFPQGADMRKTERFKALMRRAGLVDYWRAKGWPDLCRPAGADDFECD